MAGRDSRQSAPAASAPNRLPALTEAVGPSVRGFMCCIAAPGSARQTDPPRTPVKVRLEETDGLAHRRLDVQRLDILPVLLEQGDEEVDACALS